MSEKSVNSGGEMPSIGHLLCSGTGAAAVYMDEPQMPSSKPLQIFLLIALVITGAAYVTNQWIEMTTEKAHTKYPSRLREKVQRQSSFLEHTAAGKKALEANQPEKAASEFRLALQAQQSAEGHENLGLALLGTGNPDPAFAQFREAVRADPKFAQAYLSWGEALSQVGKPEESVPVYEAGLDQIPDSGLIHYKLAAVLQEMERDMLAARRSAVFAGDTNIAAEDTRQAQSLATKALHHYTSASRLGMNSPDFWTGYGELLNDQGRFSDAVAALNRALAQSPNVYAANFQMAAAQARLGNYPEAVGHYEKALTLSPDNPEVLNDLALIYAKATNADIRSPKMAVLLATRACDATNGQNARFMDTLARAYAAELEYFQAIAWEEKALNRARQLHDDDLAAQLEPRYNLYLKHKPD